MPEEFPIIQFDETRAMRYYPYRRLRIVRIVEKSADEVSIVESVLLDPETFRGSYVEVLDQESGEVRFALDYDEFMRTHTPWESVENGWYDSDPVDAYQSDATGDLVVAPDGSTDRVHVGDWLYRHLDGGVSCQAQADFPRLYDLGTAHPIPQESA